MTQGEYLEQQQRKLNEAKQLLENQQKCNCFDEMKDKVIERQSEQLPQHENLKAYWQDGAFIFNGADNCPVSIGLRLEYRRIKSDGTQYARKTMQPINILPSFCPFCGRKYKKDT